MGLTSGLEKGVYRGCRGVIYDPSVTQLRSLVLGAWGSVFRVKGQENVEVLRVDAGGLRMLREDSPITSCS